MNFKEYFSGLPSEEIDIITKDDILMMMENLEEVFEEEENIDAIIMLDILDEILETVDLPKEKIDYIFDYLNNSYIDLEDSDEDEDDLTEEEINEFVKKRKKIDRNARRKARMKYKKNKSKIKQKMKRYRKSPGYKKYKRKAKKMGKRGKTATGKVKSRMVK